MLNRRFHTPGTAPATLVAPTGAMVAPPTITLIEYDADSFTERHISNVDELLACHNNGKVSWVNIDGLGDVAALQRIGQHFGLHPLALEDVLNTGQRPKVEEYTDHFFIVSQMLWCEDGRSVSYEQVSMFLKADVLITIQEEPLQDVFEPVRARLRAGRGFARSRGHDYLAYALLDAVADHYFPVLERVGETIESMEERLLQKPGPELINELHALKRTLLQMRRCAWPERDVLSTLARDVTGLIHEETRVFIRDCYDHVVQIMDVIESYRDMTTGMMELYLSSVSTRTNEIMRVLTVVSATFIPLTFLAGIYGMNFEYMPELKQPHGYFVLLGIMGTLFLSMVAFFRSKRWI
jgi:magnesium transporter